MKKAIYALSADPITKGHLDVILRASEMFDEVIVGIGDNPNKNYTLSKSERLSITKNVLKKYTNISVHHFTGALVDFSNKMGANIIIRGLRNINDFQYEQELAAINKSLKPNLETCFIFSEPNKFHISSSSSKSIIKEFFPSSEYLPFESKKALEKAINNQSYIGITGLMGTGKSYIAEELAKSDNIHNVDLDLLCHTVYDETNQEYEFVRNNIINAFGTLDRKIIGKMVFNDDEKMKELNDIFREPLKLLIREHCRNLKGLILINGATLVAENFLDIINNQLIIVTAKEEIRFERCLKGRDIKKEVLIERDKKMIPFETQVKLVKEKIEKDNYGELIILSNEENLMIGAKKIDIQTLKEKILFL